MVHQFQIHLTLWICFLEKDKTVFERKESDFILQQSVWETSTGYCTHYWFHGASTVATDNEPTCSSSNLVSSPWLFPRYSNRVQFIQYQRWPSEVFQLCTPRQTSGCSQLPDSSLDGKHEGVVLSVDMSQRGNPVQMSYVGKFHKAPRKTKVIQRTDILSIVRASLHCHNFSCTQCSLASDQRSRYWITYQSISLEFGRYIRRKRTWFQTYEQILSPRTCPFLALRYVDNRYIIFPEERVKDRSTQTPAQEDFYEHPVELETVTTNELLGFLVDSQNRTVTYILPKPWQVRDCASAGSPIDLDSQASSLGAIWFPATHTRIQTVHSEFTHWLSCTKPKAFNPPIVTGPLENYKKRQRSVSLSFLSFSGHRAVVCESHSVPKSFPLLGFLFW